MGLSGWHKFNRQPHAKIPVRTGGILFVIVMILSTINCENKIRYTGELKPSDYNSLIGRKIFIDPGHGGKGKSDRFRIGPNDITEEEVNLRVALILYSMLHELNNP